ncbi:MAG: hypothetical protein M1134_06910 [Actinobacteria bacterium]|nr:hypothetical protein [Actinomycetota bacterium]MCL5444638.1 hypothetical protein [Actinomycetota bacterium]
MTTTASIGAVAYDLDLADEAIAGSTVVKTPDCVSYHLALMRENRFPPRQRTR